MATKERIDALAAQVHAAVEDYISRRIAPVLARLQDAEAKAQMLEQHLDEVKEKLAAFAAAIDVEKRAALRRVS